MAHLHPTRWRELQPEFQAAAAIDEAAKVLEGVSTHGASLARGYLRSAKASLHAATRNPEAVAEFEQLKSQEPSPSEG